ncbi:MAG: hypothetical protein AAF517_27880, partial [Planctomycetota bacterium]
MTEFGTISAEQADGGLRVGGTFFSEIVNDGGNHGFVVATLLSLTMPVTLPIGDPQRVIRFRSDPPAGCVECSVEFDDEVGPAGCLEPLDNTVLIAQSTFRPELVRGRVEFCCQREKLNLPGLGGTGINIIRTQDTRTAVCFASESFEDAWAGTTFQIGIRDPSEFGVGRIFASWGRPATPTTFDVSSGSFSRDPTIVLANAPRGRQLFVLAEVYGPSAPTPRDVRLGVRHLSSDIPVISELSLSHAAPRGTPSAVLRGARLRPTDDYMLLPSGGGVRREIDVRRFVSSREVELALPLDGISLGVYDIVVRRGPEDLASLPSAIEVRDDVPGARIEARIEVREFLRFARTRRLTLHLENFGDEEGIAPLVRLRAPPGTVMYLPGDGSSDEDRPDNEDRAANELLLLVSGDDGIGGRFAPGASARVPVLMTVGPDSGEFQLDRLRADATTSIDWASLPVPPGVDPA